MFLAKFLIVSMFFAHFGTNSRLFLELDRKKFQSPSIAASTSTYIVVCTCICIGASTCTCIWGQDLYMQMYWGQHLSCTCKYIGVALVYLNVLGPSPVHVLGPSPVHVLGPASVHVLGPASVHVNALGTTCTCKYIEIKIQIVCQDGFL